MQWFTGSRAVWLAAPAAEFAAVDQVQADRMPGVIAGVTLDVLAAAGMLAGAEPVTLATAAGTLARCRSPIYSATCLILLVRIGTF